MTTWHFLGSNMFSYIRWWRFLGEGIPAALQDFSLQLLCLIFYLHQNKCYFCYFDISISVIFDLNAEPMVGNLWLSVYLSEVWYAMMCKNYREERCNWITIIGCVKVLITHQIQLFDMAVWNVWKVFGLTLSFVKVSRQTNHQKHEE